jgi:hypothetical protein
VSERARTIGTNNLKCQCCGEPSDPLYRFGGKLYCHRCSWEVVPNRRTYIKAFLFGFGLGLGAGWALICYGLL